MPNRILRDSIRTSESLSRLTAEEERHFYRLMVYCDDHGRFDARPQVVQGACYPLVPVTLEQVAHWTRRLADPDVTILQLYQVAGRPYGSFVHWGRYQRPRSQTSKFPEPPDATGGSATDLLPTDDTSGQMATDENICTQMSADDRLIVNVTGTVIENGIVTETETEGSSRFHRDSSTSDPDLSGSSWQPPHWFEPLTHLEGYQRTGHRTAARKIQETCQAQQVDPQAVVQQFAEYYQGNKYRHGWLDPVKTLLKTLPVQISKVKARDGPGPNGGRPPAPPAGAGNGVSRRHLTESFAASQQRSEQWSEQQHGRPGRPRET